MSARRERLPGRLGKSLGFSQKGPAIVSAGPFESSRGGLIYRPCGGVRSGMGAASCVHGYPQIEGRRQWEALADAHHPQEAGSERVLRNLPRFDPPPPHEYPLGP